MNQSVGVSALEIALNHTKTSTTYKLVCLAQYQWNPLNDLNKFAYLDYYEEILSSHSFALNASL